MLAQVAVIPGAPLLVPELTGPGAVEAEPVRVAVHAAGAALAAAAPRWLAVGVADAPCAPGSSCPRAGDFGGFGVPVPVSLPATGAALLEPSACRLSAMPGSMLIAGWLAGGLGDRVTRIDPVLVDPQTAPADCADLGRRLRELISATDEPVGVLVVADGATALSPSAPGGGERESAWELQHRVDAALAAADGAALAALDPEVCVAEGVAGRAPWQVLAALIGDDTPASTEVRYAGAPFGVGYSVVDWRWAA